MSLRLRLLLAVGAVAALALLAADVATYQALRSSLYRRVDESLLQAHVGVERSLHGGAQLEEAQRAAGFGTFVQVRDGDDSIIDTAVARERGGRPFMPKLPSRINVPGRVDSHRESSTFLTVGSVESGGTTFRVRVSNIPGFPSGAQLIVAAPLHDTLATLHQLLIIELVVAGAALTVAAGLGWWLVRVGLRPLADVEHTAAAIADGQLDRRVPGDDTDTEVGQLARTLNIMLGRIEGAFAERDATEARLRQFVADASHELRTPLSAVAAYAEMFERGANDRPDDLARVMTGIRAETGRMGRLVEDLLLLARLDEGERLERQPVELVGLTAEAVDTAAAVGPRWPLDFHADHPVEVVGDPVRLRQVVDNLLGNVRAHTPPGTSAQVRVGGDGADAIIEVADHGPGLTAEQAGRVFERFYRADPARSRQRGGAGLGLGIVAAIVEAHGGRVTAAPSPGGGATFTVRLPLDDRVDATRGPVRSPAAGGRSRPAPAMGQPPA